MAPATDDTTRTAKAASNPNTWLLTLLVAMVPVAVATIPFTLSWLGSDRGVDRIIVESAFKLLEQKPSEGDEADVRDWAITVIEKYSGVAFSDIAKENLRVGPLPISQSASNPDPATTLELEQALAAAQMVNTASLLSIAIREVGVREASGSTDNPRIGEYNASAGLDFPDNTPWNSQFVNWVVGQGGYGGTNSGLSRSWEAWGLNAEDATGETLIPGCIAVLWRETTTSPLGMAGFYLGSRADGAIRILGGNFFNEVNVITAQPDRLLSCRLPPDWVGPAQ